MKAEPCDLSRLFMNHSTGPIFTVDGKPSPSAGFPVCALGSGAVFPFLAGVASAALAILYYFMPGTGGERT